MDHDRLDQKHPNQEPIALGTVLPFVRFLVAQAQGSAFSFQQLKLKPTRAHGILYLHEVANKLPTRLRREAIDIIERHTQEAPQLVAA